MLSPTSCSHRLWCLTAAILSACGSPPPAPSVPVETGRRPGSVGLQPLAMPCAISNFAVTISLAANEEASLSLDGTGRLIVNGTVCSTATTATMKRINISTADPTASSDEIVHIDGTSGFFALGAASIPGISVALGSGTGDTVEVIGTPGDDVMIAGKATAEEWVDLNHDVYADVHLTGVESLTLSGGDGNDVLLGTGLYAAWVRTSYYTTGLAMVKPMTLQGGAGNDTLVGGDAADQLLGGDGDDTLIGGLGDDVLNGELGNDTLDEGSAANGSDTLMGGGGTDTVTYASRTTPITVSVGSMANDGAASEGDDVRDDVEIIFGGPSDDTLTCNASVGCTLHGGPGNDTLTGRAGNDTLLGEAGNDTLRPGAGNDVVNGGDGIDTVTYDDAAAGVSVTLGVFGTPSTGNGVQAQSENDSIDYVENLVGSNFGDVLTGNALDNRLTGGLGDDTLSGMAGDDLFDEEAAANGRDTINGGTGEDRVDYSARTQPLFISLDGVADDGEASEQDNIGTDVEDVTGGSSDDTITGNALGNKLDGMAGDDTLNGLGGNDELCGGAGYDTLNGGDGDDILDEGLGGASCDCGNGFDIAICGSALLTCEVR